MWAAVKKYRRTFLFLVITNGLIGLGDIFFGFIFLFRHVTSMVLLELGQSIPFISKLATTTAQFLAAIPSEAVFLVIFYFFSHGIVKLFLAIVLFKQRLWAYPIAIFFFVLFTAYQGVVMYKDMSIFNSFLTVLNLIVLLLAIVEYKKVRALVPTTL